MHISNKIAGSIFALNQIKNILPIEIRKLVYNIVKSHLEYGIIIWGSSRCEQFKKVKTLQKKAVRIVSNKHFRAHCTPIFGNLELLKLEDLYKFNVLSFMHKYFYSKLPSSFVSMFNSLSDPNRTKSFKVEKVKLKSLESFPSVVFPKLWNITPIIQKEIKSIKSFKKTLFLSFVDEYHQFQCKSHHCFSCESH